jgi:hypothetical protein
MINMYLSRKSIEAFGNDSGHALLVVNGNDAHPPASLMEVESHHQTISPIVPFSRQNDIGQMLPQVAESLQFKDPFCSYAARPLHEFFDCSTRSDSSLLHGSDLLVGKYRDHV